jgi:hypothetical protein
MNFPLHLSTVGFTFLKIQSFLVVQILKLQPCLPMEKHPVDGQDERANENALEPCIASAAYK